jgi:hypothetical protein
MFENTCAWTVVGSDCKTSLVTAGYENAWGQAEVAEAVDLMPSEQSAQELALNQAQRFDHAVLWVQIVLPE